MLEVNDAKVLFGRPITDLEVIKFLSLCEINLIKDIALNSGEFTAHVEKKKEGYSLSFTDEAMFLNRDNQPIGKGPLYFTGVFFYSDGKDGYVGYKGKLPGDLHFSDSITDVSNKLGSSSFQRTRDDGSIVGQRWDYPDCSLSVTYSKSDHKVTLVSFFKSY